MDISKFKDLFISEAEDRLQILNDNLLVLEKNPSDGKLLDELMRSSHTIKSSSATMGYKKMAFLMHVMEDIFDYARNGVLKITPTIIDQLFKTIDISEKSLASIKESNNELNVDAIIEELKKITGVKTEGTGKSIRAADGKPIVVDIKPKEEKQINNVEVTAVEPEKKANIVQAGEVVQKIEHIKVPIKRLDDLMNLMEELLVDKMRLEQFKNRDVELKGVIEHLGRLVSDIQHQVMQARLVPVDQIFARFPRMVRDLSQNQNKQVELEVSGGEIELDRTVVDKLGEPLVHILRNAVDHGIEKSGIIKLQAMRENDFALIIVENNGVGINFGKVRQAAVKRNIIGAKEADSLNKDQIMNLLFHPRLSTNDEVTETSGRGVGLSVVKGFTDQIGGRVIIESPLSGNNGTRFTLELPLTIAIINSLLVGVKDTLFAIPFSSIERSVNIQNGEIKSMADQDVAVVSGVDVPLVYLDKVFSLNGAEIADIKFKSIEDASQELEVKNLKSSITAVLIKRGKDVTGIVIDKLINEQEIIVKPLPSVLHGTKGFSGSTILGNGKTILILDVVSLLEDAKKFVRTSR
ncbi:MAG: chemotaxis protein CheA [Patescibacteria group bacterium]